jgi:hypothetical protein
VPADLVIPDAEPSDPDERRRVLRYEVAQERRDARVDKDADWKRYHSAIRMSLELLKLDTQPQAGEPQTAAAAQAADKPALDADALRKELEDARKEAAKYRTERKSANDTLAQLQKELEAIRQAQMTDEQKKQAEFEKAQQEAAQLRQELDTERKARQELALKTIVQAAAGKLGVVDPDAAFVLLRTMTPLEPGPDGWDTKAVTEAVQKLVKDKPYLLGASTASPANPAPSPW